MCRRSAPGIAVDARRQAMRSSHSSGSSRTTEATGVPSSAAASDPAPRVARSVDAASPPAPASRRRDESARPNRNRPRELVVALESFERLSESFPGSPEGSPEGSPPEGSPPEDSVVRHASFGYGVQFDGKERLGDRRARRLRGGATSDALRTSSASSADARRLSDDGVQNRRARRALVRHTRE